MPVTDKKHVILPYQHSTHWMYFETGAAVSIEPAEIEIMYILLREAIENYNRHLRFKNQHIDLNNYRLQLIAIENESHEKIVWVNCFCSKGHDNWTKEVVLVKDGGNCYFNLKINLTERTNMILSINGES